MPRLLLLLAVLVSCQDRSFKSDLSSPDPKARTRAIEFLGSQGDRSVIPQLIEAIRDSQVEVRSKAAWALGMLQAKEGMMPLVGLLRDPEARVRQSASRALLQIEEPEAIPALREAAALEQADWVKRDIEDAMQHLMQFEGETDVGESNFKGNWL